MADYRCRQMLRPRAEMTIMMMMMMMMMILAGGGRGTVHSEQELRDISRIYLLAYLLACVCD